MPILPPGAYLIEMQFDRPIVYGTLAAALEKMGFVRVTPDDTAVATIGAATLGKRPTANTKAAASRFAPRPTLGKRPAAAAPPPTLGKRPVAAPPPASHTLGKRPAAAAPPPVPHTLGKRPAAPAAPHTLGKRPAAPAAPHTLGKRPVTPPGHTLGKHHPPAPSPGQGHSLGKHKPSADASAQAPAGGGGGGGGGDGGDGGGGGGPTNDAPTDAPATAEAIEAPPANSAAVADLWRRWREWGSPFATGPNVSGEEPPAYRFRFLAQLTNPLTITNKPGMEWRLVRRLQLNPFGDLNFKFTPFALDRGKCYEVRFLARAKAMPDREDIKQGLVNMGFAPMKLSVMQRNMRVPNRAGNSVSMWYAIATWEKGNTTVSPDDPFFFLDVEEVD